MAHKAKSTAGSSSAARLQQSKNNVTQRQYGIKSGPKRLSPLSLDHLDRKDSYFESKPTMSERKEWLIQSMVPIFGLLLAFLLSMIIYEIPSSFATEGVALKPKDEFINPVQASEACLLLNDFHHYLDPSEEYEAFYCDADVAQSNQSHRI